MTRVMAWSAIDGSPYVTGDKNGLVRSVQEAAAKKGEEQGKSIVELRTRTRHANFIHEPMDVEKRGGKFPKNKDAAVVIDERSLSDQSVIMEDEAKLRCCEG